MTPRDVNLQWRVGISNFLFLFLRSWNLGSTSEINIYQTLINIYFVEVEGIDITFTNNNFITYILISIITCEGHARLCYVPIIQQSLT